MFGIVAFFAALLGACQGQTFSLAPYNTSAEIGGNATVACIVSNVGGNSVQWKKQGTDGTYVPITLNGQSLSSGTNKYIVTGTYNLTITSFSSSDVANYQCAVGTSLQTAYVSQVVMPNNVSVYWESAPRPGGYANITCRASFGNPPPFIRWFAGSTYNSLIEQTNMNEIYYYTENVQNSGAGDAVSSMRVLLTGNDADKLFRCQVDFEGYYNVMEYTLQTVLSGSSSIQAQGVVATLLIAMAVVLRSM